MLTPAEEKNSSAHIKATLGPGLLDSISDAQLEALRTSIPAARSLPLLRQLALGLSGRTVLEYLDVAHLIVEVEPCR